MSELQTMQDALDIVKDIQVGDLVQGEVLVLQDKQAIVGIIGGGVEGVIPFNELSATPFEKIEDVVKVGDVLDLVVIKPIKDKENGSFLLSKRRVDARKVWEELQTKADNHEQVEGTVKDVVKGGLVVDAGVRAFVPASMISDHFVSDLKQFKGQTLVFDIVEILPADNRLILSRKEIVANEKAAKRASALEAVYEGAVVTGKVARLTNFGAFIDLGGIDGLVHVSEISHQHVSKPSDFLAVGQTVEAKVIGLDAEKGRVSLSIKETVAGPWDNIIERAAVYSTLVGTVKRFAAFGAFVELFPGVEGLVHISQIAHKHIATPQEVLQVGQEVTVKVLDVNEAEKRISLSIKALEEAPVVEKPEVEEVVEEEYVLPEEDVTFSLADRLGEQLSELVVED